MTEAVWTAQDVADHRGMTLGSARVWLSEQAKAGVLVASGRDLSTGAKQYRRDDVLAAIEAMPGQGSRTDLRSRDDVEHDPGSKRSPD